MTDDFADDPLNGDATPEELLDALGKWREQGGHDIHSRVDFLEHLSSTLLSISANEQHLTSSVKNLGITASALAKALETVDRNQTTLMNLANDVSAVRKTTPTKNDLKSEIRRLEQESRKERLRVRGMIYTATVLALGLFGSAVFGVYTYDRARQTADDRFDVVNQSICDQRSTQAGLVQEFIRVQSGRVDKSKTLTAAEKAAAKEQYNGLLKAFPDVNCSNLKKN